MEEKNLTAEESCICSFLASADSQLGITHNEIRTAFRFSEIECIVIMSKLLRKGAVLRSDLAGEIYYTLPKQ